MQLTSILPTAAAHSLSLTSRRRNLKSLTNSRLLPRSEMSSSPSSQTEATVAFPVLPNNRIVLGCGTVVVDYLATVAAFPKPDDKIRSTSLKVEGGGNAGNALTSVARLGLKPKLISKVANDAQGKRILEELETDGVDTSHIVVSEEGNSPFTYIIVDNETKTRTCIHTPGYPSMVPEELSESSLFSALDGAHLVYFDGRLPETALVVAEEATQRKIPILVDAEKKREGLDCLLNLATYVVCSEKFPQSSLLLRADGIGAVSGRLLVGTAEVITPSELVDTTGAGDAFIGAVLYALCAGMPPEKMLPFASQVAAAGCRALGARSGLPRSSDPRLAPFLT